MTKKDTSSAKEAIKAKGKVRMDLDSELFKGMSIQLNDVEGAEEVAKMLADMPAVKKMWPMTVNKIPDPVVEWAGQPQASGRSIHIRDNSSTETYSPHVMTQIDKLRAKGYTGKGIKVAILDSGVSRKTSEDQCLSSFTMNVVNVTIQGYRLTAAKPLVLGGLQPPCAWRLFRQRLPCC